MGEFSQLSTILFGIFIVYILLSFDSSLVEAGKKGKGGGGGGGQEEEPVPIAEGQPVMYCCGHGIGCSDQVCHEAKEDSAECNNHLFRKQCRHP